MGRGAGDKASGQFVWLRGATGFARSAFITKPAAALRAFIDHDAINMSAAVAFYAILSAGPLLVVLLAVADTVWGREAAMQAVYAELQDMLGDATAATVQDAVANSRIPGEIQVATGISVILLFFSSTLLFAQIRESLATIWGLPTPKGVIRAYFKQRLLALVAILVLGLLLLISGLSSSALSVGRDWLAHILPGAALFATDWGISWVWFTLLIAALFHTLSGTDDRSWKRVWIGAGTAALLFLIGKELIALYLAKATVASVYGTAGSLASLALWAYYSSMALFLGAEYGQVWDEP